MRAGASGFLLKDAPPEELVRAVRVVASGRRAAGAERHPPAHRGVRADGTGGTPRRDDDRLRRLTDREREVLVLMARGLSNGEIAETLIVGETTVKTHVGRVLMKLDVRDRVQAVVVAYETGLVRPGA